VLKADSTFRRRIPSVSWVLSSFLARLIPQGIVFFVLARVWGAKEFGDYVATVSLTTFAANFVESASSNTLTRDYIKTQNIGSSLGTSLSIFFSLSVLVFFPVLLLSELFSSSYNTFQTVLIYISSIFGARLIYFISTANLLLKSQFKSFFVDLIFGLSQIIALFILFEYKGGSHEWILIFFFISSFCSIIALFWQFNLIKKIKFSFVTIKKSFYPAILFSLSVSALSAMDLDKSIIHNTISEQATGVYAAAQRIVVIFGLPMIAFLGSLIPDFFKNSQQNLQKGLVFGIRVTRYTVAYSIVILIALSILKDHLAPLLGNEYVQINELIFWFSLIIFLQAVYYPIADVLAASELYLGRLGIQLVGITVYIGSINFFLENYGVIGAIYSAIFAYLTMILTSYTLIILKIRTNNE
jgi:O-antigen/teichoic acid export membrane protein